MANTWARPPYTRRNSIPKEYEREWIATELQNIQRGIPSQSIKTVVADYVPHANDFTILVDASSGNVTITLRPPDQVVGLYLNIKRMDNSGNTVIIAGTVDGVVNPTLTAQYQKKTIHASDTMYVEL